MEATKKLNGKAVTKWLSNNAIIVMMLAVSLIVGIMHPNFFSGTNMINLFKNVSIRYIIALGISGCLITTGNDLSAGRLAGFAACLACIFAQTEGASGKFYPNMHTLPTPVVFILVIAICAIVGLCNGLVVSYLKVQPFIATLGMQQVVPNTITGPAMTNIFAAMPVMMPSVLCQDRHTIFLEIFSAASKVGALIVLACRYKCKPARSTHIYLNLS